LIFWGPPGSGKTTLAKVICKHTQSKFKQLSAVTSGLAHVREVLQEAKQQRRLTGQACVLFVDEVHRFNKLQQDVFLPAIEDGTIVLIGATTENPSFELNAALLSRCRVFVLQKLDSSDIEILIRRALSDTENGLQSQHPEIDDDSIRALAIAADGDARTALNALEMAVNAAAAEAIDGVARVSAVHVRNALDRSHVLYDKTGDQHYDVISACTCHSCVNDTDCVSA